MNNNKTEVTITTRTIEEPKFEIATPEQPNISDEVKTRGLHLTDLGIAITEGILGNELNTGKADAANRAVANAVTALAIVCRGARLTPSSCDVIEPLTIETDAS